VDAETEWLRVRGIGRERFAGYIAEYLTGIGYTVERDEVPEPPATRIVAQLSRMNPSVPAVAKRLEFRLVPTSGGSTAAWVAPTEIPPEERGRLDRMVRELVAALERSVLTESHATARVSKAPDVRLPWETPGSPAPPRAP
jgi:hypothetical protein